MRGRDAWRTSVGIAFLCFGLAASGIAQAETIVLASTTSVENSGLLARILPEFTKATGIDVRVVAVGTGEALETARRGDADLVLVHDPKAEDTFMAEGHGYTRREVAWNDFIVVGPSIDPAHIAGGHDAVSAFKAIAAAKALFVSRGDRSGTDALEKCQGQGSNREARCADRLLNEIRNIAFASRVDNDVGPSHSTR
jgi:tungstate transport system substrate-binding protein